MVLCGIVQHYNIKYPLSYSIINIKPTIAILLLITFTNTIYTNPTSNQHSDIMHHLHSD